MNRLFFRYLEVGFKVECVVKVGRLMVDFLHHNRLDGMTCDILQVRITASVEDKIRNYRNVENISFMKIHTL